ncbi:MAG: ABC transporter permease [Chloroflexia bacterium]
MPKAEVVRQTTATRVPGRSDWPSILGRGVVALLGGICVALVALPLIALLLRVPFDQLFTYLGKPIVTNALRLTLISTLSSLALMIVLGTPVAYALGRHEFRGKRLLESVLELPLVLPPAVAGVALLFAFGRRTAIAGVLRGVNVEIAFTLVAVVLAQFFVAAPFYIKSARVGFQGVPKDLLDAAAVQGAGGWGIARYVLIPLALPGLAGGAVLGWARAVGEFGATILFAGNFEGRTQTMPLAIYISMESDTNAAIILSSILVLSSFTVLLLFKLLTGKTLDVTPE